MVTVTQTRKTRGRQSASNFLMPVLKQCYDSLIFFFMRKKIPSERDLLDFFGSNKNGEIGFHKNSMNFLPFAGNSHKGCIFVLEIPKVRWNF